jgi:hypothetical protein
MTEHQLLSRETERATGLPRALWPLLLPAAALLQEGQWGGTSEDGRPCCPDCGRLRSYGRHVCSCPTRLALKRLGPLLVAQEAR